jgi:hypothetical protein
MKASGMKATLRKRIDAIVTPRFRAKTYCHDNFSYCARKLLILCITFIENVGLQFALPEVCGVR